VFADEQEAQGRIALDALDRVFGAGFGLGFKGEHGAYLGRRGEIERGAALAADPPCAGRYVKRRARMVPGSKRMLRRPKVL
jgi:hypothetical protein